MGKSYEGIKECFYRVGVKAIIRNSEGRFMLCMKEMKVNGELLIKYDIPGGGIDHGENPLDALRREIKEELGLEVTKINSSPKYFLVGESADGQIPLVLTYYEVDVENLDYTASEECREMNFFTLDEALNEDLWPMVRVNFLEVKEMFGNL